MEVVKYYIQNINMVHYEKTFQNSNIKELLDAFFSLEALQHGPDQSDLYNEDMMLNFLYIFSIAIRKFPEVKEYTAEVYRKYVNYLESALKQAQITGQIQSHLDTKTLAIQIVAISEGAIFMGAFDNNFSFKTMSNQLINNLWEQIKV